MASDVSTATARVAHERAASQVAYAKGEKVAVFGGVKGVVEGCEQRTDGGYSVTVNIGTGMKLLVVDAGRVRRA